MKHDEIGLFSGLAICSGCGKRLYHYRATSLKHEQESYTCGIYRRYRNQCFAHYIRKAKISRSHLSSIEAPNIVRPFSLEVLYNIADALGVRAGDILNTTLLSTE